MAAVDFHSFGWVANEALEVIEEKSLGMAAAPSSFHKAVQQAFLVVRALIERGLMQESDLQGDDLLTADGRLIFSTGTQAVRLNFDKLSEVQVAEIEVADRLVPLVAQRLARFWPVPGDKAFVLGDEARSSIRFFTRRTLRRKPKQTFHPDTPEQIIRDHLEAAE